VSRVLQALQPALSTVDGSLRVPIGNQCTPSGNRGGSIAAYSTAILVLPTPAGPRRVSSRMSSRSISSASSRSSASLPLGRSAKTGSEGTDGSLKLAEANRVERSASGRRSPSASSRMVVSRGERRPRSRSETASGLRPARAARVSCERPERLRRRRSSSPNRFIFSLPHEQMFLPDWISSRYVGRLSESLIVRLLFVVAHLPHCSRYVRRPLGARPAVEGDSSRSRLL
jgi:hypothetical protein